jgi:hypothetical protein
MECGPDQHSQCHEEWYCAANSTYASSSHCGQVSRCPVSEIWEGRGCLSASFKALCGGWPKKRLDTRAVVVQPRRRWLSKRLTWVVRISESKSQDGWRPRYAQTPVTALWMRRGSGASSTMVHIIYARPPPANTISLISYHNKPLISNGAYGLQNV